MSQTTKSVSDQTFEAEVLKSSQPVLVDYWAQWCGPCKMIGPIIEEAAAEYADRLTVAKLNIDESPRTPSLYNVRGIPTLMLFKNGLPVATHVGSLSKGQLRAFIDKQLALIERSDRLAS
jgi:thioredoxin 1